LLIKGLSKKTIFFLSTFLCLQLVAVNEKDDFVYDLSLATQGISVSQYNTGVNYSIGRGINKDVEKAVYWYQRANEQGHSKAPFNIAIFYVDGINTDPDPELALEYFLVAEERGNKHAKEFLDKLRRADNPDLREALLKFCCPEPLSHSMIPKN
jgi:TPR repeat protein